MTTILPGVASTVAFYRFSDEVGCGATTHVALP